MAGQVVIFHLGLGQGGFLDGRPHDRLGALVEAAVHQELHELVGDDGFGVVVHRQVGVGPVAGDAKALELGALDVDPAGGEGAAFAAEGDDIDVVLVQTLGAVLLFDLPLDRQAVAIPARHIAGVGTHHLLRADDHVLEDLVQRVADVQMAVGVGRAVVQGKGGAGRGAGLVAQAVIDADPLPPGQPVRLALRQARAHGKIGFGQKDGVAVIGEWQACQRTSAVLWKVGRRGGSTSPGA